MAADKKAIESFVKECRSGAGFSAGAGAESTAEVADQVIAFGNEFATKAAEASAINGTTLRMIVQIGLSLVDVFVKDQATATNIKNFLNILLQFLPA